MNTQPNIIDPPCGSRGLSRRSFIAGTATVAAGASLAIAAPAAVSAEEPAEIDTLIAADRQLAIDMNRAESALKAAVKAFEADYEENPIRLRINLAGCLDPAYEDLNEEIDKRYEIERIQTCNGRVKEFCPEAHHLLSERLDRMKAEDLAKVPDAMRRWDERRESFDLPRQKEAHTAACDARREALKAFTRCQPATVEEYRRKMEYVAELLDYGEVAPVWLATMLAGS